MNGEQDAQQEKPWVYFDHITGSASFTFRGTTYDLPNIYDNIDSATEAAYERARLIGWAG